MQFKVVILMEKDWILNEKMNVTVPQLIADFISQDSKLFLLQRMKPALTL